MENLWKTTPAEDALILLGVLCFCFASCLSMLAIANTVRALFGYYSKMSVVVYWIYAGASFLLFIGDHFFDALVLFSLGSPFVAWGMWLSERKRIKQLNTQQNVERIDHRFY